MTNCDLLIYNAGEVLTCASGGEPKRGASMRDVGIVEKGAVAVRDRLIIAVGKSAEIEREYKSENAIDANGKIVTPGFVECHTHVVFAGNRFDEFELKIKGADYLEILEKGGGILSTVRHTRQALLKDLVVESRQRLDKLLRFGVTTCEVKTGYGLDTETELKMLAAIFALDKIHPIDLIPTFLPAHAVPPEYKNRENDYVDLICHEMLPSAKHMFRMDKIDLEKIEGEIKSRISAEGGGIGSHKFSDAEQISFAQNNPFFVDVFCERNAFNLEQSREVLESGKRFGFKIKAHVDEFTNLGAARMAIELGATSIDHLDVISDGEIALLAASETVGVITPTVNFNFGSKEFANARKLIDAGCAIAVSTDYNPGSAPCPSLANAMAIACRYQKLLPSEAFNAATINAAFAVAKGAEIGSIETGKNADLLIFDTKDYREIAYEFGGNLIEKVFKKGKIVEEIK
jgi:imidazolonepropionase